MLIIGETGCGITSFVNLLCNCGKVQTLGGDYDVDKLLLFHHFNDMSLENTKGSRFESKTTGAKLYDAQLGELKIGLIDTPGFGSSQGMTQDKANVKKIIATLEEEAYIHCICLIINGRQSQLSATLKYVMSEITAFLPRDICNNIIIVFSNISDVLDLNFDPNYLNAFFGRNSVERIFFIENPYCRLEMVKQHQGKLPHDMVFKILLKAFEHTAEVLNDMHEAIKDFKPVHTHKFITLLKKREEIEAVVIQIITSYDHQKRLEKDLKMAKEELDAAFRTKNLELEKQMEDSKAQRDRLSKKLVVMIDEFHKLGINRNYPMLIESQLMAIETRLERTIGLKATDLKKSKEILEKKLTIVNDALKMDQQ